MGLQVKSRSSARRLVLPNVQSEVREVFPANARILGLDPGSLVTGYAVIDCTGSKSAYVASGSIRLVDESLPERLKTIYAAVAKLAQEWQPHEVAIERVFMHRNADSALKLGQARGAALCGSFCVAPRVFEYAPREVKLAVVGTGSAQKEQVQMMVKSLLRLSGDLAPDAADALAIALCHAHTRRMRALLAGPARLGAGAAR
jgi:crossover junction endodeoxyribonuclease RuvC